MILKILAAITLISAFIASMAAGIFAGLSTDRNFPAWFFSILIPVEALLILAVFERRFPLFGHIFWKGAPGLNRVALTFDDGPNEPFTSRIIEVLETRGVPATFFVLGQNCAKFPDTVKLLANRGFEIGNHSWSHEVLPLKSPSRIRDEIEKTSSLIEQITGKRPTLFRAPHGWRNPWLNRCAGDSGCTPVAWTLGVWDTDLPGAQTIVRRTLDGACNGCVLLLHDGRGTEPEADSSQLIEALPAIIDGLRARGFEFVTLSRMMGPR